MNQNRINRVLEGMKERQLTQLFVADWKSIWYLTGYSCEPYERMYGLYLNADGRIVFVLNRLFMDPGDEFEKSGIPTPMTARSFFPSSSIRRSRSASTKSGRPAS